MEDKMVTRRVDWVEISEDDYYSKGTDGIGRSSVYMGTGYTIQDYYADNANIRLEPRDESDNDYYFINDDGEKILVIVWEYYYISMNHLLDGEEYIGTLEDAMKYADTKASYNQEDMLIFGENGNEEYSNDEYNLIARRRWYGVEIGDDESEKECISFGKFGHYGEWEIFY